MILHKYPNIELPTTPPTHKIAPIQLVSSKLIDPVESGDESDCKSGKYGDSHPNAHPCDKLMMLAVKLYEGKCFHFLSVHVLHFITKCTRTMFIQTFFFIN